MIAQNVAAIVADHVRLTVEAIDRMCLTLYVPRLQRAFAAVNFFREDRGQPLASSVLMAPAACREIRSPALPRGQAGGAEDGASRQSA
jgi:hypothetical protein